MDSKAPTELPELHSSPYHKSSASRHLSSTYIASVWALFVAATIAIHELAHRATWDPSRQPDHGLSWFYRPGTGLPTILRTVFAQAHGPITGMHLARLAVNALDVPWTAPKTWMEIFWLADKRWAGPVGLGTTGWTLLSCRMRVSRMFWLSAALSIVALVTPIILSRAYPVAVSEIKYNITVSDVGQPDNGHLEELTMSTQVEDGMWIWATGQPTSELFPGNVYAEVGGQPDLTHGTWLIAGNSNGTEMSLFGVRVTGGCDLIDNVASTFQDRCTAEFGADLGGVISLRWNMEDLTAASVCSNVLNTTMFGLASQPTSSALFRLSWIDSDTTTIRCRAVAGLGTASVDGNDRSFTQFVAVAPPFRLPNDAPRDPVAALILGDMSSSFWRSYEFKANRTWAVNGEGHDFDLMQAAILWDGIVAMSTAIWSTTSRAGEPRPGIKRISVAGIRRSNGAFYALIGLLGIWLIGMISATAVLLRRTWTSSLNGYAAARLLQHRSDLVSKPGAWFEDLEDNQEMLEPFTMRRWGSPT